MGLVWSSERDGARWVGRQGDREVGWVFARPGATWPWIAQALAGWQVDCATLERARELLDGHALESVPPAERRWARERERRQPVANTPVVAPHPGVHQQPP